MISPLDAIDSIYTLLKTSQLKNAITGGLYKVQRPDDSKKEDIVINALPVTPGDINLCTVNVNVYVNDLQVSIGGKPQQQPDIQRLKQLADLGKMSLLEYSSQVFKFEIANIGLIREESVNQHFLNFRLEYGAF